MTSLIAALARKCAELEKLKGGSGELQTALKLLEEAQQAAAKLDAPPGAVLLPEDFGV